MGIPRDFADFLHKVKQFPVGDLETLIERATSIWSSSGQDDLLLGKFSPAAYILDYTQRKIIYASPKIATLAGIPLSHILNGSLESVASMVYKPDLETYQQKIFPENIRFLMQVPVANHPDYLFTWNYRVKHGKNQLRHIVQQSMFIRSSANGLPLVNLAFLYEVNQGKSENRIVHTVSRLHGISPTLAADSILVRNIFRSDESKEMLTKREIEILRYLCEDLNSEEIASKINVSKHTVDNHRRNMLHKTNSKTSVGLVNFAFKEGYV